MKNGSPLVLRRRACTKAVGARHAEHGDELGDLSIRQTAEGNVPEHAVVADVSDQLGAVRARLSSASR